MLDERAPGIYGQVDACLDSMRSAIDARDYEAVYDHFVYFLFVVAAPHIENPEHLLVDPPSEEDDEDAEHVFFMEVMANAGKVTRFLADAGIYSYRKRKVRDARDLLEAETDAEDLAA